MTEIKTQHRCLHCREVIPAEKRADSKFCNDTCRARHWKIEKERKERNEAINKIVLAMITFLFPPKKKEGFFRRLRRRLFRPRRRQLF